MTPSSTTYDLSHLHVELMGSGGPHVLLLHGWGQSGQNLRQLGELLSLGFQVHLVDLPGFGASPRPAEAWGTMEYQALLVRYLIAKRIDLVNLVGHSMGGRISLRLAAENPKMVSRIGLIASHGIRSLKTPWQQLRSRFLALLRSIVKQIDATCGSTLYASWYIPRFASRDYKAAGEMLGTFLRTVNEDLTPELGRIEAPALLLYGELDQETPPALGRRIAAGLRHAEFIELPGKDHEPFKDVGSHLVATILTPFLLAAGTTPLTDGTTVEVPTV